MKKLIFILIFFSFSFCSPAMAMSGDKQLHFAFSVPAGGVGVMVVDIFWPDLPWYYKAPIAFGIGMVPGTIKETSDALRSGRSGWSWGDIGADAKGSAVGVISVFTITGTW